MRARDELFLGVDVGATNVRAAVVDASGRILGQERHRLLSREPPQVAEAVVRAGKTACGAAGLPFSEVKGLGMGVAGLVEKGTGMVLSAPHLGWKDVPFARLLQARAPKTPLTLISELSASAWGERSAGAGKGAENLVVVVAGATVGAGLVVDGRVYEGATGIAGELGHVKVHPGGRVCSCGQRGCLEAYAAGPSLAAWARDDIRIAGAAARAAGKPNTTGKRLLDLAGDPEKITPAAMEKAAHEGDELSRRLIEEAGRYLGTALANVVTLLNPGKLLLGGGLLANSPRMQRACTENLDANVSKSARAGLQIAGSALGEDAGVVGAALLAREAGLRAAA